MAELKTKATDASVADYIASRASDKQQADCRALMAIFKKATGRRPRMWGPSIVGYGAYRHTNASGTSAEMPTAGFAIRGRELVVYLTPDVAKDGALASKLGKHKMGKCCLYFRRLADIDEAVLEQLIVCSVAETKRRHG